MKLQRRRRPVNALIRMRRTPGDGWRTQDGAALALTEEGAALGSGMLFPIACKAFPIGKSVSASQGSKHQPRLGSCFICAGARPASR